MRSQFLGLDGEGSITAPAAVRDSSHGRPNRRCGQTSNVPLGSRVDGAMARNFLTFLQQLVGCGHVSGLLMRQVVAAGPNALRRIGSQNNSRALRRCALTQNGLSRFPGTTVSALCRHALANWCCRSICWRVSCRPANSFGSLYLSPRNHDGPGHPAQSCWRGRRQPLFVGRRSINRAEPRSLLRSVLARGSG